MYKINKLKEWTNTSEWEGIIGKENNNLRGKKKKEISQLRQSQIWTNYHMTNSSKVSIEPQEVESTYFT